MRSRILGVAAGLSMILTTSGPARADSRVVAECWLYAVANHTITGSQDTFTGVMYYGGGKVDDREPTTMLDAPWWGCYVKVAGSVAAGAPPQYGLAGYQQVTFHYDGTVPLEICISAGIDQSAEWCEPITEAAFPFEPLYDLLYFGKELADSTLCIVVSVLDDVIDCPPYDQYRSEPQVRTVSGAVRSGVG